MESIVTMYQNELRDEMASTRRVLERVPDEKLSWKPHDKSRSLGELAGHIAAIPAMVERILTTDEFSPPSVRPPAPASVAEIVSLFDRNVAKATELMGQLDEAKAGQMWRFVFNGKEVFRRTRVAALRTNFFNHIYHHRAQLGVYLRLLGVAVPMVYGPTADENPFM